MRIREPSVEDVDTIAALNVVVQQLHYEGNPKWFKAPDPAGFAPVVREWLLSDLVAVRLAETDEGVAVGYVSAILHERSASALTNELSFVELDQIAVRPEFQHLGVGRALVEEVFSYARSVGVATVQLSVWGFNPDAHRFFVSLGFLPMVERMTVAVS